MNGKCTADAIAELKKEGYANASVPRIKHAIMRGYVDRPELDGGGRYKIVRRNMDQFRRYLDNVPSRGPRPGSKRAPRKAATAS